MLANGFYSLLSLKAIITVLIATIWDVIVDIEDISGTWKLCNFSYCWIQRFRINFLSWKFFVWNKYSVLLVVHSIFYFIFSMCKCTCNDKNEWVELFWLWWNTCFTPASSFKIPFTDLVLGHIIFVSFQTLISIWIICFTGEIVFRYNSNRYFCNM